MSAQNPIIMVVEDENLLLQAINKKLHLAGLEAVSCNSGKQAFDYLDSLPERPDVIWLDYYLKDMNGLDFMARLREKEAWSHIPVVVVSNSASPEKVTNMLALGARKYLLKAEHRLDELITIMKEFIQSEAGSSTPPQPASPASPPS